jgi:hypothetical protein
MLHLNVKGCKASLGRPPPPPTTKLGIGGQPPNNPTNPPKM